MREGAEPLVTKNEVLDLREPRDVIPGHGDEAEVGLDARDDDPPQSLGVCLSLLAGEGTGREVFLVEFESALVLVTASAACHAIGVHGWWHLVLLYRRRVTCSGGGSDCQVVDPASAISVRGPSCGT